MLRIVGSRLLQGIVVLAIISMLVFSLLAAAGGDALTALSSDPLVSRQAIADLRHIYGLDQPVAIRYAHWVGGMARGSLGESFYFHAPVAGILWPRLLNTLELTLAAFAIACAISLPLGALAARRPASWFDRLSSTVILLGAATPRIVVALAALAVAARYSLLSGSLSGSAGTSFGGLLVAAFVMSVPLIAPFLAQARDGLETALREEFVQVARAKGLSERAVLTRHALRAALNPLITIFGYSLGGLVGGSVIVETVLGWPGIGQLSVIAVRSRDVPLLMAAVLVTSAAVLAGNFLADMLQRLNDPRLRESERPQPAVEGNTGPGNLQ